MSPSARPIWPSTSRRQPLSAGAVSRVAAGTAWPVIRPQWTQDDVAALLDAPSVIGVKPYYSLISPSDETRDVHLEASIFEFLPHHILEVVNDRHAWVTLHVPKADRLGHADNVREVREIRRRYPAHRARARPPGPLLYGAARSGGSATVCG